MTNYCYSLEEATRYFSWNEIIDAIYFVRKVFPNVDWERIEELLDEYLWADLIPEHVFAPVQEALNNLQQKLSEMKFSELISFWLGGDDDIRKDGVELANLKVVSVKVTKSFVDVDGNDFVTADGLRPGMTVDEVKALYGEPSSENSSYIGYHFQNQYETDELRSLGVAYAGEDSLYAYMEAGSDIVNRIELQYFGIAEAAE